VVRLSLLHDAHLRPQALKSLTRMLHGYIANSSPSGLTWLISWLSDSGADCLCPQVTARLELHVHCGACPE